jgi:hypothetical protein
LELLVWRGIFDKDGKSLFLEGWQVLVVDFLGLDGKILRTFPFILWGNHVLEVVDAVV